MQVLETVLAYCRAKLSASLNLIYNLREGVCDDLLLALRADPLPRHPPVRMESHARSVTSQSRLHQDQGGWRVPYHQLSAAANRRGRGDPHIDPVRGAFGNHRLLLIRFVCQQLLRTAPPQRSAQ